MRQGEQAVKGPITLKTVTNDTGKEAP